MSLKRLKTGPSRRGNNGEFSWGPTTFGAPPPLKITDKGVSDGFFPKSNIHEIHFLAGLRPDPGGEAYDAPQTDPKSDGEGTPLPCFLPLDAFGVSISAPTELRPREHGFPGPAAAVDGPGMKIERTLLLTAYIDIYRRSIE